MYVNCLIYTTSFPASFDLMFWAYLCVRQLCARESIICKNYVVSLPSNSKTKDWQRDILFGHSGDYIFVTIYMTMAFWFCTWRLFQHSKLKMRVICLQWLCGIKKKKLYLCVICSWSYDWLSHHTLFCGLERGGGGGGGVTMSLMLNGKLLVQSHTHTHCYACI